MYRVFMLRCFFRLLNITLINPLTIAPVTRAGKRPADITVYIPHTRSVLPFSLKKGLINVISLMVQNCLYWTFSTS